MGNRLSKIYTRTGDAGDTGLGDGSRTAKDSARVDAYGTTDELNAALGLLIASDWPTAADCLPSEARDWLLDIQHDLFDIGAELCVPGHTVITAEHVTKLEQWLDTLNAELQPLKEFILRGGTLASAHCHLACTVARRAERLLVTLHRQEPVSGHTLAYLNRLSDLLFVLARSLNKAAGRSDVLWQRQRNS